MDFCLSAREHVETLSMTPKRAQYANLVGWPKTCLQQSHRMQILDPLTVRNVALAPGNVLHMMCVNQEDFEPVRFQYLIKRNPVLPVDSMATDRILHCCSQSASAIKSRVNVP